MDEDDLIRPPWTDEQVRELNEFQQDGRVHPFTCGNRDAPGHRIDDVLRATHGGWVCDAPGCSYWQGWAWKAMLRGGWAQAAWQAFDEMPELPYVLPESEGEDGCGSSWLIDNRLWFWTVCGAAGMSFALTYWWLRRGV